MRGGTERGEVDLNLIGSSVRARSAIQDLRPHERSIEEFAGAREVSAKEAYELTSPLGTNWAEDAGLMRIVSNPISGPYVALFPLRLPNLNGEGRLQ